MSLFDIDNNDILIGEYVGNDTYIKNIDDGVITIKSDEGDEEILIDRIYKYRYILKKMKNIYCRDSITIYQHTDKGVPIKIISDKMISVRYVLSQLDIEAPNVFCDGYIYDSKIKCNNFTQVVNESSRDKYYNVWGIPLINNTTVDIKGDVLIRIDKHKYKQNARTWLKKTVIENDLFLDCLNLWKFRNCKRIILNYEERAPKYFYFIKDPKSINHIERYFLDSEVIKLSDGWRMYETDHFVD